MKFYRRGNAGGECFKPLLKNSLNYQLMLLVLVVMLCIKLLTKKLENNISKIKMYHLILK